MINRNPGVSAFVVVWWVRLLSIQKLFLNYFSHSSAGTSNKVVADKRKDLVCFIFPLQYHRW